MILVRRETNPDDLHGMIAAHGILTSRGGKTSHAAVVARGMGKTCVCGADELEVESSGRQFTARPGWTVSEGDVVSIDGTSRQAVYLGEVPVVSSSVVQYFEGELHPHAKEADDLVRAVHASWSTRTPSAASASTPTRTPAPTALGHAGSARAASAWSGPSTCSSASAASSWRT